MLPMMGCRLRAFGLDHAIALGRGGPCLCHLHRIGWRAVAIASEPVFATAGAVKCRVPGFAAPDTQHRLALISGRALEGATLRTRHVEGPEPATGELIHDVEADRHLRPSQNGIGSSKSFGRRAGDDAFALDLSSAFRSRRWPILETSTA
jgi:hypothetical protein